MNENLQMTFWELYKAGGIMMWPIAALGVLAIALGIERILYFARALMPQKDLNDIRARLLDSDFDGALDLVGKREGPVPNVLRRGLERMVDYEYAQSQRTADFERQLRESIIREAGAIERNTGWIGVVAQAAPLFGLLGTVQGMIETFFVMMRTGGQATAANLAGGIGVALITTFAGLAVGIPAFVLQEHFAMRARDLFLELERIGIEMTNAVVHARQPEVGEIQIETL